MNMKTKAKRIMSTNLVSVEMSESLDTAHKILRRHNIRHLPVVTSNGEVVGVISDRDFLRAMSTDTVIPADFGYGAQVKDFMSFPVVTVSSEEQLIAVLQKMIDDKISCVLVTQGEDKEVVGIVTHEDLLRAFKRMLYPIKDGLIESFNSWISKTPIGDVAHSLATAGI